jgi:predicted dehydrogenase
VAAPGHPGSFRPRSVSTPTQLATAAPPQKLARLAGQFGFATTTELDAVIADASADLVDICLPTRLHTEVAVRAMQAGRDVLIELPLAATLADARRIVATQRATGRQAFVDMFSRFSPAGQRLR